MTKRQTLLWILLIIGVVSVAGLPFWSVPNPWPPTVWQSFSSWRDAWDLPPLPRGSYVILLAYYKRDGGRLSTNIKVKVVDETDNKTVPLFRDWESSDYAPFEDWQIEEVAYVQIDDGHRYRIELDPDQLQELARYRHRLGVDVSIAEKMNWDKRTKN